MRVLRSLYRRSLLATDRVSALRYRYRSTNYLGTFLGELGQPADWDAPRRSVPRTVWCFWTGDNELTANRIRCLQRMREVNPIQLVTPDNLNDFVVDGYPLHPAYEFLSLVHRSDYLRAYAMHHHGGGYSDIKFHTESWGPSFDRLDADPESWALGYPEIKPGHVVRPPGKIGRDLRVQYRRVIGCGAFIFRPGSPMTREWLTEVECRLTAFLPELEASPGNLLGDNLGYPIEWAGIMGAVYHPLALKYHGRLLQDGRIRPLMEGYR